MIEVEVEVAVKEAGEDYEMQTERKRKTYAEAELSGKAAPSTPIMNSLKSVLVPKSQRSDEGNSRQAENSHPAK